ncbi:MAG: pseudaminic acid biosynthesis N-acetyl transferase [Bacillales bacterium]|jgi:UDP-4-amino-4,6-dideoxy-N-acetyl-beta-L-altrosamine N-acetyltransferase|nr:pseudaminic acid biosynthesis N-acetyl transferase [Bacillales bacterium]
MLEDFSLRNLEVCDLERVLIWRNSPRIRRVMFTTKEINWENHQNWYRSLVKRDADVYVKIFQFGDLPIGLVNLTDINEEQGSCNWGFYTAETPLVRKAGTALGYLAIEFIFEELNLLKVVGEVLDLNVISQNFHKKLFFDEMESQSREIIIDGESHLIYKFELTKEKWEKNKYKILEVLNDERNNPWK